MPQIGPYQVLKELARGGMGVVYLAQGPTGEQVAVKLLLAADLADPELHTRFRREAQALEALDHPGILRVRSHGVDKGRPYMVMDLLPGPTLAERVESQGPLPESRVVELGRSMATALAHAHSREVVHRDLKPSNVILRDDDPVLVDFGLVRLTGHDVSRLTQTGAILGSPNYMPPEQVDGAPDVGPAADVYGLGATLYYLLSGRPPFEGSSVVSILSQVLKTAPPPPSQLRPGLDPALEAVVLRCLHKDPKQRYASALDLAEALARAGSHPFAARRPRLAAWLLPPVAALLAAAGAWALSSPDDTAQVTTSEATGDSPETVDAPASSHQEDRLRAERLVDEAQDLVIENRYAEALRPLDQAVRLDPTNASAYSGRGLVHFQLDDLAAALTDLDRAIQLDPGRAAAYSNRGALKVQAERYAEAILDFDQALRLERDDPVSYANRAGALVRLKRFEEALADFEEALARRPCAPYYAARGELLLNLRRDLEALDDFDHALRFDRSYALAHSLRGKANLRLGRYTDAIDDCTTALRLDPSSAKAYFQRAKAKLRLRRTEEAIDDYTQALRLEPDHVEAIEARGEANMRLERFEEAVEDFDQVLRLDPRIVAAYTNRAYANVNLGRPLEAIEDCDAALELDPDDVLAYINRGSALVELDRYPEALVDTDRGLALDPTNTIARLNRGSILNSLGRHAEAIAELDEVLQTAPEPEVAAEARRLRALAVAERRE